MKSLLTAGARVQRRLVRHGASDGGQRRSAVTQVTAHEVCFAQAVFHNSQHSRSRVSEDTPMRHRLLIAAALLSTACSSPTVITSPAPQRSETGPSTAATLGIPPGHLPPPGQCRVWFPGRPPGQQPAPAACTRAMRDAPAGTWVLERPSRDRRHVRVHEVDGVRVGVIVRIVLYEAATGKLVREERKP